MRLLPHSGRHKVAPLGLKFGATCFYRRKTRDKGLSAKPILSIFVSFHSNFVPIRLFSPHEISLKCPAAANFTQLTDLLNWLKFVIISFAKSAMPGLLVNSQSLFLENANKYRTPKKANRCFLQRNQRITQTIKNLNWKQLIKPW